MNGRALYEFALNNVPQVVKQTLDNSSVATIPTLLDLIHRNKLEKQAIMPGDKVVFASVGAGMNINALLCQF